MVACGRAPRPHATIDMERVGRPATAVLTWNVLAAAGDPGLTVLREHAVGSEWCCAQVNSTAHPSHPTGVGGRVSHPGHPQPPRQAERLALGAGEVHTFKCTASSLCSAPAAQACFALRPAACTHSCAAASMIGRVFLPVVDRRWYCHVLLRRPVSAAR